MKLIDNGILKTMFIYSVPFIFSSTYTDSNDLMTTKRDISFKPNHKIHMNSQSIYSNESLEINKNRKFEIYDTVSDLFASTNAPIIKPGAFNKLKNIYDDVLFNEGICEEKNTTIIYDINGNYLGRIKNTGTSEKIQRKIDDKRIEIGLGRNIPIVVSNDKDKLGYPLAYDCGFDTKLITSAIDSLDEIIYGSWNKITSNGSSIGETLINYQSKNYTNLDSVIIDMIIPQYIVESSGNKEAESKYAIGVLQITPRNLNRCGIPKSKYTHRIAQMDCAHKLQEENVNVITNLFNREGYFYDLDENRKKHLINLLAIQSYNSGTGNISKALKHDNIFYYENQLINNPDKYSVEDVYMGIIASNFKVIPDIGTDSLSYTTKLFAISEYLDIIPKNATKNL